MLFKKKREFARLSLDSLFCLENSIQLLKPHKTPKIRIWVDFICLSSYKTRNNYRLFFGFVQVFVEATLGSVATATILDEAGVAVVYPEGTPLTFGWT